MWRAEVVAGVQGHPPARGVVKRKQIGLLRMEKPAARDAPDTKAGSDRQLWTTRPLSARFQTAQIGPVTPQTSPGWSIGMKTRFGGRPSAARSGIAVSRPRCPVLQQFDLGGYQPGPIPSSFVEKPGGGTLSSEMWATSLYNLICYGSDDAGIFHSLAGTSTFRRDRVLKSAEHTAKELVAAYREDLGKLALLPALVVAETAWGSRPRARLSRVMNIHTSGLDVVFEYQHLETEEFSSQDVFQGLDLAIGRWERGRTHWAVKRGDAIGALFKFFASRSHRDRPVFFDVDEWPLPNLGHVAVMMPVKAEFDPVYEAIANACKSLRLDPQRVDHLHGPRRIVDDIFKTIMQSAVVISDITGMNPNVFYETGLAHARNRQVILIAQGSKFPFDIQSYRVIKYLANNEGLERLRNDLRESLKSVGLGLGW